MSMSDAWPWKPPLGWWIMIRECGRRIAFAFRSAREQQRAHARGLADADRADVGLDELHRVVDRQARGHDAARRVDIEVHVLVGVLGLQEQQLRDHEVRDVVVDTARR